MSGATFFPFVIITAHRGRTPHTTLIGADGVRSYSGAEGDLVQVHINDKAIADSNGWLPLTTHGKGTTAQRPSQDGDFNLANGSTYHDTDLSKVLVHGNGSWYDPASGAKV